MIEEDKTTCTECGKKFKQRSTLVRHMNSVHTGVFKRPIQCWYCDFTTNRKPNLKAHCMHKHEMEEDEFVERAKKGVIQAVVGETISVSADEDLS